MAKQATTKKATTKRTTAKKPVGASKKTTTKKSNVTIDPTYNPNGVTFLVSTAAVMILFSLALLITM